MSAESVTGEPERDRSEGLRYTRAVRKNTIIGLGGVAGIGLVGCILYSSQFSPSEFPSVLATSLIVATASIIIGATLGFLFGIPRGQRTESESSGTHPGGEQISQGSDVESPVGARVRANTNLEDISDWLTKILVGVGLTQLSAIGGGLSRLAASLRSPLGGAESSSAFGLAVVITFAATGFLIGYLWTRLTLPIAFQRAETEVEEELRRLLVLSRKEQQRVATDVLALVDRPEVQGGIVQSVAERLSTTVGTTEPTEDFLRRQAADYERTRRSMPRGSDRTRAMSQVVARVRAVAQRQQVPAETLRAVFRHSEGGRVVALAWISSSPDSSLADIVLEGIEQSKSAFELYHALRAAETLLPTLPEQDRVRLTTATRDQMQPGRFIKQDSDRWPLAQRLLSLAERP